MRFSVMTIFLLKTTSAPLSTKRSKKTYVLKISVGVSRFLPQTLPPSLQKDNNVETIFTLVLKLRPIIKSVNQNTRTQCNNSFLSCCQQSKIVLTTGRLNARPKLLLKINSNIRRRGRKRRRRYRFQANASCQEKEVGQKERSS